MFVASLTKASFSVVPLQAACAPSPGTPGVVGAAALVPGLRRAGKLLPANPSHRDTRCTPLLREGNLITTLIALPAWQDAAAARGDPWAAGVTRPARGCAPRAVPMCRSHGKRSRAVSSPSPVCASCSGFQSVLGTGWKCCRSFSLWWKRCGIKWKSCV